MQLVKHIMRVQFRGPYEESNSYERTVNCADIELSRQLGREIAVWMTKVSVIAWNLPRWKSRGSSYEPLR